MYQDHVRVISAGMRSDPDIFVRGVTFALLSIRTQFVRIREQMTAIDHAGTSCRCLWGFKRGGYDYLRLNAHRLHRELIATSDSETAIAAICEIPGFGIVKAAFVAQLMGFDVGCLDTRNITRLGLNPREWRSDGGERKNTAAFRHKITRYVEATGGRAEELWNDWCKDVARVYKTTAEDISKDHTVIVPRNRRSFFLSGSAPVPVVSSGKIPFDSAA